MKVIREGKPEQVECKKCGSLLEYEPRDVESIQTHINEYGKYITCPVCKSEIKVG